MKTYIVNSGTSTKVIMVATNAKSKTEAYNKVKKAKGTAQKSSVLLSACHINYVGCEKLL